ncbi:hypothetical protein ACWGRF_00120 [Streptomyces zhihengii]
MKTTRAQRPEAESHRERAWAHLLDNSTGIRRMATYGPYEHKRLGEIARRYDQICQRAQGLLHPGATESDVLAALLVIRALRDKLNSDELMLISLARSQQVTWARIATALEMKSRQSAERRHLQLSQAQLRADGTKPRTQSERVEVARERRSRRAERDWARSHARAIRAHAEELNAIGDLQRRADRSREAMLMQAPVQDDGTAPAPVSMTWPAALEQCLAEHIRLQAALKGESGTQRDEMEDWRSQQHETDILHRMLGLLRYAADPRHLDLSDRPGLRERIAGLDAEFRRHTRR